MFCEPVNYVILCYYEVQCKIYISLNSVHELHVSGLATV